MEQTNIKKMLEDELELFNNMCKNYHEKSFDEKHLAYLSAGKTMKAILDKLNSGYVFVKSEN